MKLAITGGAGFLGLHLANKLKNKYKEIKILDIQPINKKEYPKNTTYHKTDIRNYKNTKKNLEDTDKIIHAAAALPLWKPKEIYTTTIQGTRNVLEAAVENKINRVVYISSTAVYNTKQKKPITEKSKTKGTGAYAKAKIQAEKICRKYREKGLITPINRPKTFIGTGRLGVFQILYDWIQSGKRIPMIGDGKNKYQLLEVEDLVDSIQTMLTAPENKANHTFNTGAEEYSTMQEDFGSLCRYADSQSTIMKTPAWLVKPTLDILWKLRISPLYKWIYDTADKDSIVSTQKIREKLGFKPKYSNKQALTRSYQWYLDHKHEIQGETGLTHRTPWKQGALSLVKKIM